MTGMLESKGRRHRLSPRSIGRYQESSEANTKRQRKGVRMRKEMEQTPGKINERGRAKVSKVTMSCGERWARSNVRSRGRRCQTIRVRRKFQ